MECVVEAVSTTRKKLVVSLSAEEVNAALNASIAEYRKDLVLPGFRKGKVPASVIERRFGNDVASHAMEQKINAVVGKAIEDNKLTPLSGMEQDNHAFIRNQDFNCTVAFDVLPDIDFPNYIGLPVEETRTVVTEEEKQAVIERLRENIAELVDVAEDRLPQDGDVIDVNYSGVDEAGQALDDVKGEHFSVTLGKGEALPDFEALVKTIKVGEEKSGPVVFPENYGHQPLAGKTVTFTILLNAIKQRNLPEVDEEFAKKVGSESLEKMEADLTETLTNNKKQTNRNAAMQKLLDNMMEGITVDIPESLLNSRISRILGEHSARLERMGKKLEELGEGADIIREEAKNEALATLRPHVFLMALGIREKLAVTNDDVNMAIYNMSIRVKQDYQKVREVYERSGLIYELRDRILADKAIEFVYSKAVVTEVDPVANPAGE